MIRPLVLLLALLAGPAAAQTYGLPPAIAPCGDAHLDADRYRADLEARGWIFVPPLTRAMQVNLLSETFVALVSGGDGPRAERIEASRPAWARLSESQLVFTTPDSQQALMVVGGQSDDGTAQLRCWMAFLDGGRMDTLFEQLLADADDEPEIGEEQVLTMAQEDPATGRTLSFYLTRPYPEISTPANRAGIATILSLPNGGDR